MTVCNAHVGRAHLIFCPIYINFGKGGAKMPNRSQMYFMWTLYLQGTVRSNNCDIWTHIVLLMIKVIYRYPFLFPYYYIIRYYIIIPTKQPYSQQQQNKNKNKNNYCIIRPLLGRILREGESWQSKERKEEEEGKEEGGVRCLCIAESHSLKRTLSG